MTEPEKTPVFLDTLKELSGGDTQHELNNALVELIEMVQNTGKKGSLSLTLTVRPGKGNSTQLVIEDALSLKLPKIDREITVLFTEVTPNGLRVTRNDPRQPKLPTMGPRDVRAFPATAAAAGSSTPVPANVNVRTGEIDE